MVHGMACGFCGCKIMKRNDTGERTQHLTSLSSIPLFPLSSRREGQGVRCI